MDEIDLIVAWSLLSFMGMGLFFYVGLCIYQKRLLNLWLPVSTAAGMVLLAIWIVYRGTTHPTHDPVSRVYGVGEVLGILMLFVVLLLGLRYTFAGGRRWRTRRTRERVAAASRPTVADEEAAAGRRRTRSRPGGLRKVGAWVLGTLVVGGVPILLWFLIEWLQPFKGAGTVVVVALFLLVALMFLRNHSARPGRPPRLRDRRE